MNIYIVAVNTVSATTKKGEPYSLLEITFKNDKGQVSQKKLTPFGASKPAYEALTSAKSGDYYSVETAKNGMYVDWTGVSRQDGAPAFQAEEKNVRSRSDETQSQIIRQSCIKAAADLFTGTQDVQGAINAAKQFEAYVLKKEVKADMSDLDDDIPF